MSDPGPSRIAAPLEEKLSRDGDWSKAPLGPGDEIDVMIHSHAGEGSAAAASIEAHGGTVESNYSDIVHATIRADRIEALASASGVRKIEEQSDPKLHSTSEGVNTTNADQVQNLGIEGETVTVAVIDLFFDDSQSEISGNVIDTIGQDPSYFSKSGAHGTACAEIVVEMAPQVDLVLASATNILLPDLMDDITSAHDPDVMSMSLGYKPTLRLDGNDYLSNRITEYTSASGSNTSEGGVFCVSAGNEAAGDHWDGPWQDSGNGYMDFGGGTEFFEISPTSSDQEVVVQTDADWSTDQGYLLELYDGNKTLIKSPTKTTTPAQAINISSSGTYYLKIKDDGLDGSEHFDIFTWGNDISFPVSTSERSLGIPATSPDDMTLTTGAVYWDNDTLESFSSRGPTQDGRRGTDIVAPDGTQSDTYGSSFYGTSAACPHAAGAAALLAEFSTVENEDIVEALTSMARGISGDGDDGSLPGSRPNTEVGHGYVEMDGGLDELVGLVQRNVFDPAIGRAQFGSPVADADRVYFSGLGDTIVTYTRDDASDWDHAISGDLSDCSPVLGSDRVFLGSGGGHIYAFRTSDGATLWSKQFESAVTSTPAFANDTVYFATNDGTVRAADDTNNGTILWSQAVGGQVFSELAYANELLFVTTNDGELVCLDTASLGAEQWRFDTGTELGASSPTIANGRVFVAADKVYAFDRSATKNKLWESTYGGTAGSSPAYSNGTVFVGSSDGSVYALDDTSGGAQLWSGSTGDAIAATPVAPGDRVVVPSMDGNLYAFLEDGTKIGSTSLPSGSRSSPLLDDNDLYVGTRSGKLVRH